MQNYHANQQDVICNHGAISRFCPFFDVGASY